MLKSYNNFLNENTINDIEIEEKNTEISQNNKTFDKKYINKLIDNAYKYFKSIKKPVNTLDIMNYVEKEIKHELSDNDYNELYYMLTGEDYEDIEIEDLEEEEKFIIR